MRFHVCRKRFARRFAGIAVSSVLLLQAGCGPQEYQKPIQQFQDATAVVVNATRAFLNNMNLIEQNRALDEAVFEKKSINLSTLDKVKIISPEEIKIRTDTLEILAQYTSNLAQLAQGKAGSDVGDSTTKLSNSLKTLANDAKKLPGGVFDNAKFSGIANSTANIVGDVAQLIVQHKARHEIELSLEKTDPAVTALIQQISDDATAAYLRQKNQLGAYGSQLSRDYELELRASPDPILLLGFANTIKNYRVQQAQLAQANPAAAINEMKKAHEALVAYARSKETPKNLHELITAVENFANSVKPLGQAVQALISNAA
jgi:hypothetical protein